MLLTTILENRFSKKGALLKPVDIQEVCQTIHQLPKKGRLLQFISPGNAVCLSFPVTEFGRDVSALQATMVANPIAFKQVSARRQNWQSRLLSHIDSSYVTKLVKSSDLTSAFNLSINNQQVAEYFRNKPGVSDVLKNFAKRVGVQIHGVGNASFWGTHQNLLLHYLNEYELTNEDYDQITDNAFLAKYGAKGSQGCILGARDGFYKIMQGGSLRGEVFVNDPNFAAIVKNKSTSLAEIAGYHNTTSDTFVIHQLIMSATIDAINSCGLRKVFSLDELNSLVKLVVLNLTEELLDPLHVAINRNEFINTELRDGESSDLGAVIDQYDNTDQLTYAKAVLNSEVA